MAFLLWGEHPPGGVRGAVQQIASRVRRGLALAGLADGLRAVPPGYALEVPAEEIDVRIFRAGVRTAIDAQRAGDHVGAAAALTSSLELWSGDPLADLVDLPLATVLSPAIDDERGRA